MRVKDVMIKEVKCCRPLDSAHFAAKMMRIYDVGAVLVVSDMNTRHLEGILTDRDLCCTVVADANAPECVSVQEVMTSKPVTCKPEDSLEECERLMQKHRVRRIPVVDEAGCCVGIVTQTDIARHAPAAELARTMAVISKPRHAGRRSHLAA